MSRLELSIIARRLAKGDAILSRKTFSGLTQAEIDAIAKGFGAPTTVVRRKNPSLVPVMAQPMQQQATSPSSPLQQEQAMAQSDQQQLPKKGEFGGICGSALCTCVDAKFEYVSEEAERGAFGKFFCAGCSHDKNRQARLHRSQWDSNTDPVCIERTVAPPKVEKDPEPKSPAQDNYWDLA